MHNIRTATPGAFATTSHGHRAAVATTVTHGRPRHLPMDGEPTGGTGGAATAVAPAPEATAGVAAAPAAGGAPAPGTAAADIAAAGHGTPPAAPPAAPDPAAPPAGNTPPPADRSLDQFPAEIRDYIAELRKESGDNRIKAKTAAEAAEQQKQEWLTNFAKAIGLMTDESPGEAEVPPEQRVAQLADQLTSAQNDHKALAVELAIFKGAAEHSADPSKITDSRRFMNSVKDLDPASADFESKLAAAIGAAVANDPALKVVGPTPPAPVVQPQPPVPSGGDFAGGPSGGKDTGPQTVEDFIAMRREKRAAR